MTSTSQEKQSDSTAAIFKNQKKIIVMGVVNTTPDSFSDGGLFLDPKKAIDHALRLIDEGADVIDIGGESTRPGSEPVEVHEELARVIPVIEALSKLRDVPISIDTCKIEVARQALDTGATVVNDISGLTAEPALGSLVARFGAGIILMHKRGTPKEMQQNTHYENLIDEISMFLENAIGRAINSGIDSNKIMIDPGIGFGKDLRGNISILNSVGEFRKLGKPVLIGASRKSFIGNITGALVTDRLYGSVAAAVAAVLNGADAVRVHDVKETRQAVDVAYKLRHSE
jgi:dihydropteroate synthase